MEPPGTAPGSDPRITGAFIAIVPVARNSPNIGAPRRRGKRHGPEKNARRGPPGAMDTGGRDQNPALIASNSSIIRLRNSSDTGVWAKSVVVIGLTKAASVSPAGIAAIAASFADE